MTDFTTQDWIEATPDNFDLTKEAEAELLPLLKQIDEVCMRLNIPFVIRAVVKNEGGTNSAVTGMYLGGPTRATCEILAMSMLRNFSYDYLALLSGLADACNKKFLPAGVSIAELDPNDPGALEKLLKGHLGD